MNKEIEIPEGYEARIEGNKVVLEQKESEDEKIRKTLVEHFKGYYDKYASQNNANVHWKGLEVKKVINYLERQKEPENVSASTKIPFCWEVAKKEQKLIQFKGESLAKLIKGEFEGFRNLLKKSGIDYEPQSAYWEGLARLFDSAAKEYIKEQKPLMLDREIEDKKRDIVAAIRKYYPADYAEYLTSFFEGTVSRR